MSNYICTHICIYTFMVCADFIAICKFLCVPLVANSSVCYWLNICVSVMFVSVDIIQIWMYLYPCLHAISLSFVRKILVTSISSSLILCICPRHFNQLWVILRKVLQYSDLLVSAMLWWPVTMNHFLFISFSYTVMPCFHWHSRSILFIISHISYLCFLPALLYIIFIMLCTIFSILAFVCLLFTPDTM